MRTEPKTQRFGRSFGFRHGAVGSRTSGCGRGVEYLGVHAKVGCDQTGRGAMEELRDFWADSGAALWHREE